MWSSRPTRLFLLLLLLLASFSTTTLAAAATQGQSQQEIHNEKCVPAAGMRNDRVNCTSGVCHEGWAGELCNTALCRQGCHPVHGYCTQPGECKCALGWRGKDCEECVPLPGCKHGSCNKTSYQCICDHGWQGNYCSIPVCHDGCHSARGYCKFPNECRCRIGWGGDTCEDCKPLPGCLNGYCTKPLECRCREGWKGLLCDTPICRSNCSTVHGFCLKPGECRCEVGWWGENCATCFPYPGCQHGTCEAPWECNCKPGWKGFLCDRKNETGEGYCEKNQGMCLNGGTCINVVDERNYTCSCPPLFTGEHCDYLVYSRASIFPIFSRGSSGSRSTFSSSTNLPSSTSTTTTTTSTTTPTLTTTTATPITTTEPPTVLTTLANSLPKTSSVSLSTTTPATLSSTKESVNEARKEVPVTYSVSTSISMSTSSFSYTPPTEPPVQKQQEEEEKITVKELSSRMLSDKQDVNDKPRHRRPINVNKAFIEKEFNHGGQSTYGERKHTTERSNSHFRRFSPDVISLDDKRKKYIERKSQSKSSSKSTTNADKEITYSSRTLPAEQQETSFLSSPNRRIVLNSRLVSKSGSKETPAPILLLELSEPTMDFDGNPISDTDANSPQANLINWKKNLFLRHHETILNLNSRERNGQQSYFPFREVRLVSQDTPPRPSHLRISPYIFTGEFDSYSEESSHGEPALQSFSRDFSHLPPQTRVNRRIPPSSPLPQVLALGRFSPHEDHELAEASTTKEQKEGTADSPAMSYYEEHYNGRVHIGDVTEVDRHAPFEEIVDAFIELKKLTS